MMGVLLSYHSELSEDKLVLASAVMKVEVRVPQSDIQIGESSVLHSLSSDWGFKSLSIRPSSLCPFFHPISYYSGVRDRSGPPFLLSHIVISYTFNQEHARSALFTFSSIIRKAIQLVAKLSQFLRSEYEVFMHLDFAPWTVQRHSQDDLITTNAVCLFSSLKILPIGSGVRQLSETTSCGGALLLCFLLSLLPAFCLFSVPSFEQSSPNQRLHLVMLTRSKHFFQIQHTRSLTGMTSLISSQAFALAFNSPPLSIANCIRCCTRGLPRLCHSSVHPFLHIQAGIDELSYAQ
mmetsp:Transcript_9076/g.24660  ORF Transcript_9076/g.24660 Transcript_9076/m.24660 type:complete len:292 (+) Transcript_9076:2615-3490(+)